MQLYAAARLGHAQVPASCLACCLVFTRYRLLIEALRLEPLTAYQCEA